MPTEMVEVCDQSELPVDGNRPRTDSASASGHADVLDREGPEISEAERPSRRCFEVARQRRKPPTEFRDNRPQRIEFAPQTLVADLKLGAPLRQRTARLDQSRNLFRG